jgi:sec-independent protein translocase protein TatB
MFEIGWGELLLIGIVALIAIGPKELPGVLRTLGQWTAKLRRMAGEFQSQFQEAMREAEMADLKKQVDELTTQTQSFTNFDPVGEVRREFESTQRQIETAVTSSTPAASGPAPGSDGATATGAAAPSIESAVSSGSGSDTAAPATAPGPEPSSAHVEPDTAAAGGKPA